MDAIDSSLSRKDNREMNAVVSEKTEKVVVVIIIDGYENVSRKYGYRRIKHIVSRQKNIMDGKFSWD